MTNPQLSSVVLMWLSIGVSLCHRPCPSGDIIGMMIFPHGLNGFVDDCFEQCWLRADQISKTDKIGEYYKSSRVPFVIYPMVTIIRLCLRTLHVNFGT